MRGGRPSGPVSNLPEHDPDRRQDLVDASGVSGFIASTPQPAALTAVCSSPGPTPVTTITLTQTGVKWQHKLTALTGPGISMSVMRWFKFAHGCDSRLIRSDHSRRGICY